MNDRELLEMAAKAAGFEWRYEDDGRMSLFMFDRRWVFWSPLTDDGDALRLACQLFMSVSTGPLVATASLIENSLVGFFPKESTIDQPTDVAVRRVIVRAAAEIGRSM